MNTQLGYNSLWWLLIGLLATVVNGQPAPVNQNQPALRGLTSLRKPFVEKGDDGKLKGYFVDLLDELAAIGNFTYTLTDSNSHDNNNDGFQNRPTGLINDIYRNRADFAIADYLYQTVNQQRYVDFSEPYLESNLSALLRKDRQIQNRINTFDDLLDRQKQQSIGGSIMGGIQSMGDLVNKQSQNLANSIQNTFGQNQNQMNTNQVNTNQMNTNQMNPNQIQLPSNNQQQPAEEQIQLGTIRQIYRDLSVGTDPLSRRIYEQLHNNPNNLAENRQIGVDRALNTPYAFIQESINNELAIDEHCELTHVKLETPTLPTADIHFKYGIIGQKYSSHLETFNRGIRELKANGRLDELKRRYWNTKCNSGHNSFEHYKYWLTMMTTMISLSLSLFMLN